jgi:serine/threonine protein kinase
MAAIELRAGATLGEHGRYELKRVLGTGGMASVWLAADTRLQREVAIKLLSDVLALDADYVARFRREARIAASITHPHLVTIYDYGAEGSRPYLVLEYIAGGTLADRLRHGRDAGWDATALAEELLEAIGYIHAAGIIHRDIKPANVLIGTDGRARLTDFGIAQPSEATQITRTGQVVGTQRYLAPEVLAGEPATIRSDLYACGVLLGECVAGGSPGRLGELVDELTAADPRRRPESAAAALLVLHAPADEVTQTMRMSRRRVHPAPADAVPRPRRPLITHDGRAVQIHLSARIAALTGAAAVLVVALILIVSGGGSGPQPGGGSGPQPGQTTRSSLRALPPSAPLSRQLNRLALSVANARP